MLIAMLIATTALSQFYRASTTVIVAELRGNLLRPYHVGDSGILAFGQKGNTHVVDSGKALRRARLNDEKGIFTGLPKGNSGFPSLSERHFSQGIGSDN